MYAAPTGGYRPADFGNITVYARAGSCCMSLFERRIPVRGQSWQERLTTWVSRNSQPQEGWWAILLSLLIVRVVGVAVRSAEWVPEITAVPRLAVWSLALSFLVAKRVSSTRRAWVYMISFGVLLPFLTMANLWPTGFLNAPPSRINLLTFLFRMRSWGQALFRGEATSETAVFTLGLLIGCWLLIAAFGWMTFRMHHPQAVLLWLAVGMGANAYFGAVRIYLLIIFALLSLALLVTLRQSILEHQWRKNGVEYPRQIGERIYQYSLGIGVLLLVLALFLLNARSLAVAVAFSEWPPVQQAESWLEQAFGGVNSDRVDEVVTVGQGFASVLPRSYLLGNAPELYENVVMTARVERLDDAAEPRLPLHWRSTSYDIYTGAGWARGDETERAIPAGVQIAQPSLQSTVPISQSISWVHDNRTLRYSLGAPLSYEDDVTTYRNNSDELMWVGGELPKYTAVSQVSTATVEQLRVASVAEINPGLLKRYTQLPSDLPSRVTELAEEIVAGYDTPYAQAKAIEQFVRQYPYSLDVAPPPEGRDVVDFFLFDLQSGYCDYYATSMVVLARSVGLPARMGTGFVTHTPDENGVQTIFQIDGHSWAEVYFAGYGWIEFEPTSGFLSPDDGFTAVATPDEAESGPIALPEQDRSLFVLLRNAGLSLLGLFGIGRFGLAWLRFRRLSIGAEYGQLLNLGTRLGLAVSETQTPFEMETVWIRWLNAQRMHPVVQFWIRLNGWLIDFREYVQRLVRGYVAVSYSAEKSLSDGKRPLPFWKLVAIRTLVLALSKTQTMTKN
ncbi:MAG: transglutaminase-like domain-containing protein [Chloroflexota bacterium]